MRLDRIVLLLIVMAGCKSTIPTSNINYSEDLSVHRPELSSPAVSQKEEVNMEEKAIFVPLSGSIQQELDSIATISYQQNKDGKLVDGFVFQVYSGSSRSEASEIKDEMETLFPELEPKLSYRQPSFRVKAGQFTDRLEANRVYQEVKKSFPRALLIPERFTLTYE